MPTTTKRALLATALFSITVGAAAADPAGVMTRVATIAVPGEKLVAFDMGFVDGGTYYLSDRSNKGIDLFDIATRTYKGRLDGFIGSSNSKYTGGPNGVVVVPSLGQLWAGDGDSSMKGVDLKSGKIVASVPTGGKARVAKIATDGGTTLLVNNDADVPPFATLIATGPNPKVLTRITFANATNGLGQPLWDGETGVYLDPVTELDKDTKKGEIAVIDPKTGAVVKRLPVSECQPTGLAEGPDATVLVGCSADAIKNGFKPKTILMDKKTGAIVKVFDEVGGSDQLAFDPKAKRFYVAARGMPGGPVMGILDAAKTAWLANVPGADNTHSVSVDAASGQVFLPQVPNPACPTGCVFVYQSAR